MELLNTGNGKQIGTELKTLASVGLTVQSYCVGIQQQPLLLIPADVAKDLPDVNAYLCTAQTNAGQYLTQVQPQILAVVTDVEAYSKTFPTFAKQINGYIRAWASGSDDNKVKALNAIGAMRDVARAKARAADTVSGQIGSTLTLFNSDVSHFEEVDKACEIRITGKKGELAELEKQISKLNKKIAGASVGVGLSCLAVIGGVIMICVGAIADFATAGTSTPLIVAGGILTAVGVGGLIGSSIVLADLVKEKGVLLDREAALDTYVAAVSGIKSNIDTLCDSTRSAAECAGNMQRAWSLFSGDLKQVEDTLTLAQSFSALPSTVQLFFESAEKEWDSVSEEIRVIKSQMTGVTVEKLKTRKLLSAAGASDTAGWARISGDTIHQAVS